MEKIKKKRGKRRLFIAGIIFVILLALLLSYKVFSSSSPQIISASVYPTKVIPGDVMLITVAVQGNINSVVAENMHDKGSDKINLHLKEIKNNTKIYEGSWIVHDTTGQFPYRTYITVTGKLGKTASEQVEWLDPTVSHKASEMVGGGTFGAGDYAFPGNLNLSGSLIGVDNNTKLLLHFDGSDGDTLTIDSSPSEHSSISFNGSAQIDTAQNKFGGASLLLDGTGDYLNISDSDDWNFGSGDFTIDLWLRINALPGNDVKYTFTSQYASSSELIDFNILESGTNQYMMQFRSVTGGSEVINGYSTLRDWSAATWYHIALVRSGNTFYFFRDGVLDASFTDTSAVPDIAAVLQIGIQGTVQPLNGSLDEIRISKGIARWTSDFTMPSRAYGRIEASDLTVHGDITAGGSSGIRVKVGSFTRDTAAATGTQAVTGVGFKPVACVFLAHEDGADEASWGMDDGTSNEAVADNSGSSAGTYSSSGASIDLRQSGGGTQYEGIVSSWDSDGFTISWTKSGSPTGTLTGHYLCFG